MLTRPPPRTSEALRPSLTGMPANDGEERAMVEAAIGEMELELERRIDERSDEFVAGLNGLDERGFI